MEKPLTDSGRVYELFQDLQNETKEKLITISLDIKLKIICFDIVAIGSIANVSLTPFETIRSSIALHAHGIILVHNHPSGDPKPSKEDITFTKKLKRVCNTGGLIFHDHIVIGDDKYFSFADKKLM